MTSVAIVYHSGYGHTAVVAGHVLRGAQSVPGVTAELIQAAELASADAGPWDRLAAADAIVFGAPTYVGSASAPMKQFMDASSKVWFSQGWKDKLAAGFSNSGSWSGDKLSTLLQFAVLAAQHGMIWGGMGMFPGANSSKGRVVPRLGDAVECGPATGTGPARLRPADGGFVRQTGGRSGGALAALSAAAASASSTFSSFSISGKRRPSPPLRRQ